MEIVRVKNAGTTPFKDGYDSQPYLIPPGSEAVVPYEAACLWLGDPNARDIDARHRNRVEAFARLRVRWGVYDNLTEASDLFPKLEVYDLEGHRIYMVVDDPDGLKVNESALSNASNLTEVNLLRAQLEAMKVQQNQILALLASKTQGDIITDAEVTPLERIAQQAAEARAQAISNAAQAGNSAFQSNLPDVGDVKQYVYDERGQLITEPVTESDDADAAAAEEVGTDSPNRVRISNPSTE